MNTSIFTIGHSTHSFIVFAEMLKSFDIRVVADIRSYPGSQKYPQYNKESLADTLPEEGIEYVHLAGLGGRRKAKKDSPNIAWQHEAFRGYADYMETPEFGKAAQELTDLASLKTTAIMCAESLWWRCHRSMVSDYFLSIGWHVFHITGSGKCTPHTYTKPAKIEGGRLRYY